MPTETTPLPWGDSTAANRSESPPVLRTPRLELRRMTTGDAPLLAALRNDPEVGRYLRAPGPFDEESARLAIGQFDAHWARHGYGMWAFDELASGACVGYGGLRYLAERGETEVIGVFARSAWGKGYATELGPTVLRFAFERAGLNRLIGLVDPEHLASRRVVEKLGLRLECELRFRGATWLLYARTRPDAGGGG